MPPEGADIRSRGAFANPAGIEAKYFTTRLEDAQAYAALATSAFGDGPFEFVETSLENAAITPDMRVTVDRGLTTIVVPTNLLPSLGRPRMLSL
jgi:hypothetical protein